MMNVSFASVFSRKNLNLVVGLITLLIILWVVMFAVPELFVSLFNTVLGNLILLGFIILSGMYNTNLAIGFAVVFIILWRFSHIRIENFIL
jgi:DNA-binding transcriptional regulator of glucitol operon